MLILGINSIYHESAACLLRDGEIVAFAEEERFNRIKHGKKPRLHNPDQLPHLALRYCLEEAGATLADVSHIAYSCDPDKMLRLQGSSDQFDTARFVDNIRRTPQRLRALGSRAEFVWVDHHSAHAASAFFPSGFDEAAVLSIDGIGDGNTAASFHGTGPQLRPVQDVPAPHSLGFLWELCSMFLGFDIYDAAKIMGLAAYGDPSRFAATFRRLVRATPEGRFETDQDVLRFIHLDYLTPSAYFQGLEETFGFPRRFPWQELTNHHYDLAAGLQDITDDLVLHMVEHAHRVTGSKHLCLAGGVALNCVTNRRAFEEGPFDRLFVQPACHDGGTALGAALYVWHHLLGHSPGTPMQHAYWGPVHTPSEVETALHELRLTFSQPANLERAVAELLTEGNIVGYFHGRMEIGPRALGNRSLLADPRRADMRTILNYKVKHREPFRPFAPSVLAEEVHDWFEIAKHTSASDYMLMAYPARTERRERIPAVLHTDFSGRIQTVRRQTNPSFHRLISEFRNLTGVPIVLNTSFNDSEPIVCSPRDAMRTFLKTKIDFLAVEGCLVSRAENLEVIQNWGQENMPGLVDAFDRLASDFRVTALGSARIFTDRLDYVARDQVLPLFPEHQFFVDEIVSEKMKGASLLELEASSASLAIAALHAGARSAVAIDANPRARLFGGLNAMLNRASAKLDLRHGQGFEPVAGQRFDYVIANPPFGLMTTGIEDETYGLATLREILHNLEAHLSDQGHAQFVAYGAGNAIEPTRLVKLCRESLPGTIVIRRDRMASDFVEFVQCVQAAGMMSPDRAVAILRRARADGVTHLHLCMVHYDRGPTSLRVEVAPREYSNWGLPLPSLGGS